MGRWEYRKMYKTEKRRKSNLSVNNSNQGESIERKVERMVHSKEPIKDGAPLIYTEKKDGVGAGYNIRTDRFDVALDGIDKTNRSYQARREEKAKMEVLKNDNQDGGAEPIQGTK